MCSEDCEGGIVIGTHIIIIVLAKVATKPQQQLTAVFAAPCLNFAKIHCYYYHSC